MRGLLDTHTFLWWITENSRLSTNIYSILSDGDNELYLSAASGWEIAIKAGLGRLQLPANPEKFIAEQVQINSIIVLPIQMSHALYVYSLPAHHNDPFDRMLIAQAKLEDLTILTADPLIAKYDVKIIW